MNPIMSGDAPATHERPSDFLRHALNEFGPAEPGAAHAVEQDVQHSEGTTGPCDLTDLSRLVQNRCIDLARILPKPPWKSRAGVACRKTAQDKKVP